MTLTFDPIVTQQCMTLEVTEDDDSELCSSLEVAVSSEVERSMVVNSPASILNLDNDGEENYYIQQLTIAFIIQHCFLLSVNLSFVAEIQFGFGGDSPEVTGNDMRVFLNFLGCANVTCFFTLGQSDCKKLML